MDIFVCHEIFCPLDGMVVFVVLTTSLFCCVNVF